MKRLLKYVFKALGVLLLLAVIYSCVLSSLDIYNDFAYDRAILRQTPYGYTPMLHDVSNYGSWKDKLKAGEYVYVEDWTSQKNGRVIFAKVKSGFQTGYINRDMLVRANVNPMPVISVILLALMFVYALVKLIKYYSKRNCTQQKLKLRFANQF